PVDDLAIALAAVTGRARGNAVDRVVRPAERPGDHVVQVLEFGPAVHAAPCVQGLPPGQGAAEEAGVVASHAPLIQAIGLRAITGERGEGQLLSAHAAALHTTRPEPTPVCLDLRRRP